MLAKVTLHAVVLFLEWPDKWTEVCDHSYTAFSLCNIIILNKKEKRMSFWTKKRSIHVFLPDELLIIFASWFLLNPPLSCVLGCDSEKILSGVSLWHIITADCLALIWRQTDLLQRHATSVSPAGREPLIFDSLVGCHSVGFPTTKSVRKVQRAVVSCQTFVCEERQKARAWMAKKKDTLKETKLISLLVGRIKQTKKSSRTLKNLSHIGFFWYW